MNTGNEQNVLSLSPTAALRVLRTIMSDTDLTPAQRIAASAVVLQADGATGTAWASYRQLRSDYGLCNDVIAAAFADDGPIIGRYLIPDGRGARGAKRYRVLTSAPASGAQSKTTASITEALSQGSAPDSGAQGTTSAPSNGAQQRSGQRSTKSSALRFSGSSAPLSGTILTPESENLRTPQPPVAGGESAPCQSSPESEPSISETVNAAYRAIFDTDMPRTWERRIARMNGTAAVLAGVSEQDIRASRDLALSQKRPYGLGWLDQHMREKAARAKASKQRRQQASSQAQTAQQRAKQQQSERVAKVQAMQKYFESLPESKQTEYRRKAREGRFAPKTEDRIKATAAFLAWQDKKEPAQGSCVPMQPSAYQ